MKKIGNYIKDSIKWLWQFPQNMIALCIEGVLCQAAYREGKAGGNTIIVNSTLPSAMSLGGLSLCESYVITKIHST